MKSFIWGEIKKEDLAQEFNFLNLTFILFFFPTEGQHKISQLELIWHCFLQED